MLTGDAINRAKRGRERIGVSSISASDRRFLRGVMIHLGVVMVSSAQGICDDCNVNRESWRGPDRSGIVILIDFEISYGI